MTPKAKEGVRLNDDGISVLEMLLVLAICALVAGVVAASLQGRQPAPVSAKQIISLIDTARLEAMRTGEAVVVTFTSKSAASGDEQVTWLVSNIAISTGVANAAPLHRIVLFPDGTVSSPLSIHDNGGDHILQLPIRVH